MQGPGARTRPAAGTRRTRFRSTSRRAPSPAPPGRPPRLRADQGRAHRALRRRVLRDARSPSGAPPRQSGRSIHVGVYEQQLARARARQTDPAWKADYTATRPKVERKIGSSDATPARRPSRPRPRAHQSRCRLLAAGCRGEPRAARDARCHPPHRSMGGKYRLSGLPGDGNRPWKALTEPHRSEITPGSHPNPSAAHPTSQL